MVYLAGNHWTSSGCCGSVSSFKATLIATNNFSLAFQLIAARLM